MSAPRAVYIWLPELAQRWGLTERTLRRWAAKGEIGDTGVIFTYSRVGRRYGWTLEQVIDLEAEMTRNTDQATAS
jgi:hypothetical protein